MTAERISELQLRLYSLEKKIGPLQWDLSRNQINEFKKTTLEKLREEFNSLKNELDGLQKGSEN